MFGSAQVASRLRYFALIPAVSILLLAMGCGSSPDQRKATLVDNGGKPVDRVRSKKEPSYPDWFWNMPGSGEALFAVGMAETSARSESSEKQAIADGVMSLTRSLSAQVKGGRGTQLEAGRVASGGSGIDVALSPEMIKFVEDHHKVVATCATPAYTFVLLRLGENGGATTASSDSSTNIPEKPEWVNVIPKKPGYLYASGESRLYFRETTSWELAENRARATLALSVESKVRSLTRRYTEDTRVIAASDVIDITTDVQLNRAQVIARWKYPKYEACHVLVRMPVSANSESVANLVRSVLAEDAKKEAQEEPKEATSQKSQMEIIQEVFDELDRLTNPEQ